MSRKRKNRSFKTVFKSWSRNFYQSFGKVVFFLIVLALLLTGLAYRYIHTITDVFDSWTSSESISRSQKKKFIQEIVPVAQELYGQYGILPSVSTAQAILESEYGHSELAADYYNLFGVKTDASDPQGVNFTTAEFVDGEWIEIVDRFKVYESWEESMLQHAELIYFGTSWNEDQYSQVLGQNNFKQQTKGLQSSGYATDPDYANKLIEIINEWDLDQYDKVASDSE